MISVYDYIDYRCFLKDRFNFIKQKNPSFSYRSFNRLAGIKSSGFLKLVIDGKRNLANEGIRKISLGFRLSEDERNYFELLVRFNQATNHEEKDHCFKQLCNNKKFIAAKPLMASQYRLFSRWYYVAILEAVRFRIKAKKDINWLQKHLRPEVERKLVKEAVQELVQLKLLREKPDGTLVRKETMLTTEDEVQSLSVAKFHQQMSQLAAEAVMSEAGKRREFSGLTVAISESSFSRAKQEIQNFRKRLHAILEQDSEGGKTIVAQVNFQLFQLMNIEADDA